MSTVSAVLAEQAKRVKHTLFSHRRTRAWLMTWSVSPSFSIFCQRHFPLSRAHRRPPHTLLPSLVVSQAKYLVEACQVGRHLESIASMFSSFGVTLSSGCSSRARAAAWRRRRLRIRGPSWRRRRWSRKVLGSQDSSTTAMSRAGDCFIVPAPCQQLRVRGRPSQIPFSFFMTCASIHNKVIAAPWQHSL